MATGVIYLRPSADISVEHTLYPTDSASAYSLINEEVCDADSTYIVGSNPNTDTETLFTSVFSLQKVSLQKAKVTDISFGCVWKNGASDNENDTVTITISFGDSSLSATSVSGTSSTLSFGSVYFSYGNQEDFIEALNNYIKINKDMPTFTLTLETLAGNDSADYKDSAGSVSISQIYVKMSYGSLLDIHKKKNDTWTQSMSAYQKQNGTWVEIAEDECKNYLKSNLIINKCAFRGHVEAPMSDIAATCLETGMTGGKVCTFCGEDTKAHDTIIPALGHNSVAATGTATCTAEGMIGGTKCSRCGITLTEHNTVQPALGHNYNQYTGKCSRCTVYSSDRFSFTIQRSSQTSASTYYAMPNATWGEWADAQTLRGANGELLLGGGWQVTSDNRIRYCNTAITTTDYTVDNVTANDLIISGHAYTATDATT